MAVNLWLEIARRLEHGERMVVATIATSDGSVPRGAGAKMLVGADGGLVAGSLGGGLAEGQALAEAAATCADGKTRRFTVDMSGSARDGADLICGGRVTILVQPLTEDCLPLFRTLRTNIRAGKDSVIATPLGRDRAEPEMFPLDGMPDAACLVNRDGREYFVEPVRAPARLILAGGGHVSLATARIAATVGFEITVLDDRAEFVSPARFPWLDPGRLRVVPAFVECLAETVLDFLVNGRTFVAILTRGHAYDSDVLAQALRTPAGYIGMIGSSRKREMVYQDLRGRGFSSGDLARVHSPIGLSIGAETPEEIAVSIAAELVAVRAGMTREK